MDNLHHKKDILQRQREAQRNRWEAYNLKIERNALQNSRRLRAQHAWWEVFQKQANALDFMQEYHALKGLMEGEKGDPVRLFAYEYGAKGQRNFIATTYSNFWDKYYDMKAEDRHYYEVICEGLPCHLYFDLEFPVASNPLCDGDHMVTVLIQYVISTFEAAYGVRVHASDFLHLDSTSKTKFSRHLIMLVHQRDEDSKHFVFATNADAGNFVRKMCLDIERDQQENLELQCLFVNPEESCSSDLGIPSGKAVPLPPKKLFIDQGVYSRNRCFRLFLSSKWGLNKPKLRPVLSLPVLQVCKRLRTVQSPPDETDNSPHRIWPATEGTEVEFFPFESPRAYFFASLICNVDSASVRLTCEDVVHPQFTRQRNPEVVETPIRHTPHSGSRFPCLDRYISSLPLLHRGGQRGFIRKCVELESSLRDATLLSPTNWDRVFCFTIGGNRWCGNVQRPHKSNSIYLVCDLRSGTIIQKCFDPDCRAYRSPAVQIPQFVLSLIKTEEEDDKLMLALAETI